MYVSSSEATALHNGTKTLSITIKWVCAGGGGGGGGGQSEKFGGGVCVLNVQGDAKARCGTLKAEGGGGSWGREGLGGVTDLGK